MRLGQSFKSKANAGFTAVEVLTALVIVGILVGIFATVCWSNWKAMEGYSARAALHQEMDLIVDRLTNDARSAENITVTGGGDVVNFFLDGTLVVSYQLDASGQCIVTRGAATETLSTHVDPAGSSFMMAPPSLKLHLVLADNVFDRRVEIETTTEIYPRNN